MKITIKEVENYLKTEKKDLLKVLEREYEWATPEELIKDTISKCFGVIMFMSEYSNIKLDELDTLWDEYHMIFRALLISYQNREVK